MKRLVIVLALAVSACGSDSPTAPTPAPILPANLASMGNLNVTGCTASTGNLFSCFGYSGAAQNSGTGCASGVRGVTTTYDSATRAQVGVSNWSYNPVVRPNEQIAYNGISLLVTGPLTGGWYYTTTMSWDNVKCP
jgi:hypothetical protein